MAASWERYLERWTKAGLIDTSVVDRVRAYETEQEKARGLKWPIVLAIATGAIGLIAWGMKEARKERVNLGIVGFALTVLFFYFLFL